MELGCVPGNEIQMIRQAPFGDPIAVLCSDTLISIRRSEAVHILIEPIQRA
jgi:ferrous iron transport protein A